MLITYFDKDQLDAYLQLAAQLRAAGSAWNSIPNRNVSGNSSNTPTSAVSRLAIIAGENEIVRRRLPDQRSAVGKKRKAIVSARCGTGDRRDSRAIVAEVARSLAVGSARAGRTMIRVDAAPPSLATSATAGTALVLRLQLRLCRLYRDNIAQLRTASLPGSDVPTIVSYSLTARIRDYLSSRLKDDSSSRDGTGWRP